MVALSWSGGKDSALALHALRREQGTFPAALLTTVTEDYGRVSMHGVRRELVHAQAHAAGVPLVEVAIPADCSNDVYEARMARALGDAPLAGVETMAFADLFLQDIRAYREQRLATGGWKALFPLWGRDTAALAREFIDAGFEAVLVCVDPSQLDPAFAGGRSISRCWPTSRQGSIRAARTASFTPSCTPARSSIAPSRSSAARRSSAMALSSATCCRPTRPDSRLPAVAFRRAGRGDPSRRHLRPGRGRPSARQPPLLVELQRGLVGDPP